MASSAFSKMDWNSRSVVFRAPVVWPCSFCARNRNLESSSTTVAKAASRARRRSRRQFSSEELVPEGQRNQEQPRRGLR